MNRARVIASFVASIGVAGNLPAQGALSNYEACLRGLRFGCDESRLTAGQKQVVAQAVLKRNYEACLQGLRFGCDESRLTAGQKQVVAQAVLRRNYEACLRGLQIGCDQSKLSPSQ